MIRALPLALVAVLALATPAAAKTEVATSGDLRAELSYKEQKDRPPTDITLRVIDGEDVIAERVFPDDQYLTPVKVRLVDVDGDGTPEAIFDLFTGGAHCCSLTYLYRGATEVEHDWGNSGYRLRDVDDDGVFEFLTRDEAFVYRYSSYAASLPPIQVLRLNVDEFVDASRDPVVAPLVRRQARGLRRIYRNTAVRARTEPGLRELVRSALAGYAADRCLLGQCDRGYALLRRAKQRGDVRPGFPRRVRKDLRKLGYDQR